MQRPPPRWPPRGPWARPVFVPPPRPIYAPFHPFLQPLRPSFGFFPRFVPRPILNAEQQWLDSFERIHCNPATSSKKTAEDFSEPPLRILRRRVAQAQNLVAQLKVAATELATLENQLAVSNVENSQLCVQHEQKIASCEAIKSQLDALNATNGFFTAKQLAKLRAFAIRVDKKKAYRKKLKLRRRADASIRRAVELKTRDKVNSATDERGKAIASTSPPIQDKTSATSQMQESELCMQRLNPETLTLEALIQIRRAWDFYIVPPYTPGASTIPPLSGHTTSVKSIRRLRTDYFEINWKRSAPDTIGTTILTIVTL